MPCMSLHLNGLSVKFIFIFRKSHFGLSSLCETCSERQLKLKKQLNVSSSPSSAKLHHSGSQSDLNCRYASPSEHHHAHTILLNNALFLLQMINAVPESHQGNNGSIVPLKSTFSCYKNLGVNDSQIEDEDDGFSEISSFTLGKDIRTKSNGDINQSVKSENGEDNFGSMKAEYIGLRKRKTSNGDRSKRK